MVAMTNDNDNEPVIIPSRANGVRRLRDTPVVPTTCYEFVRRSDARLYPSDHQPCAVCDIPEDRHPAPPIPPRRPGEGPPERGDYQKAHEIAAQFASNLAFYEHDPREYTMSVMVTVRGKTVVIPVDPTKR